MKGKQFIYIHVRPRPPKTWQDISCKTLNFAVNVITAAILTALSGGLVLWCLT